ncbi:C1QL [Mytilus edulis]|uniref:C1QL n=1 Tax=Mytilus edulis TaxID=6550 RepID=A0A8S3SGI2_MYTED|nr:C1QL [Mytilus edulis]
MKSIQYQLKLVEENDGKCYCTRRGSGPDKVAFMVRNSAALQNIPSKSVIVYNTVVTNLGNGYDSSNGIFTAPSNAAGGVADHASGSQNVILDIKKDDKVFTHPRWNNWTVHDQIKLRLWQKFGSFAKHSFEFGCSVQYSCNELRKRIRLLYWDFYSSFKWCLHVFLDQFMSKMETIFNLLYLNEKLIARNYAAPVSVADHASGSQIVIVNIKKGDKVFIRIPGDGRTGSTYMVMVGQHSVDINYITCKLIIVSY